MIGGKRGKGKIKTQQKVRKKIAPVLGPNSGIRGEPQDGEEVGQRLKCRMRRGKKNSGIAQGLLWIHWTTPVLGRTKD